MYPTLFIIYFVTLSRNTKTKEEVVKQLLLA